MQRQLEDAEHGLRSGDASSPSAGVNSKEGLNAHRARVQSTVG